MANSKLNSKMIHEASLTLDIGQRASIWDIKRRYRELVKKWHPDKFPNNTELCKEKIKEINHAYEVIMAYCENYLYSFKEEDIVNNLPVGVQMRERWEKQYGSDPMWS
ncbi:MAG: J domain-containing protein [Candidatus Methanofastidiosa archaeon]|nr:J domain-containing protein [Candidatus Methanofastidiosa archaeon]